MDTQLKEGIMALRKIDKIIVHCADTPDGKDFTIRDIDRWHKERGWQCCGYHHVIRLDGTIENGRPLAQIGAHCKGYNENSIGICLIGRQEFTPAQLVSLRNLIGSYRKLFPGSEVFGHYELCRYKSCPYFNVKDWYYGGIFKQI